MIRRFGLVLPTALILLAGAAQARVQTVDELVARNIEAKGGRAKIEAVTSIKQTAHLNMQGMQGTLVVYSKRPNLLRQEITMGAMTVVNAFDGETAWMINPFLGSTDPVVMGGPEAEQIKDQSSFEGPLSTYKAKGSTLEFEGEETLDGRKVDHLKLTDRNRNVEHIYLDATTALEVRMVSDTPNGTLAQELGDYRDVEGLKIPFLIKTSANNVPMGEITVDKVEFNVPIDDALFKLKK